MRGGVVLKTIFKLLIFYFITQSSFALFEFNGEYGLDRQVYGDSRQNKITSKTYSGSISLYLFNYTAIEVNYSNTETITKEQNNTRSTYEYDIINKTDKVVVESYGLGLRQAFANRKARFVPTLSLGYAKRFARNTSGGTVRRNADNATAEYSSGVSKLRFDSVFATIGLNIRITAMLSLRASAQSIFKAFEFNRAQDNMKYLFGFSWYL